MRNNKISLPQMTKKRVEDVIEELAPTGVLRVGINLQNSLLVSRRDESGTPVGVAPSMARAVADWLDVPVRFVTYESAKALGDAAANLAWDIGLLGAEPERADRIEFSDPYCQIDATYMVPTRSPFQCVNDVDRKGARIAVSAGSAYGLWVTRNIKNAELVLADSVAKSQEIFIKEQLDALAGLRPTLLRATQSIPAMRVLEDRYTAVLQAIGTPKGNSTALQFLSAFVEEAKRIGVVSAIIEDHCVSGLSVV